MDNDVLKKRFQRVNYVLLIGALMFCNPGHAIQIKNKDKKNIKEKKAIRGYILNEIIQNGTMVLELEDATRSLKEELEINYKTTVYDRTSEFIVASGLKGTMAVASGILATYGTDLPYFTENKRKYMSQISTNSIDLLWLQYLNSSDMRNADRQEIYRIRRAILKAYSDDEKRSRALLLITAATMVAQNQDEILLALQAFELIN